MESQQSKVPITGPKTSPAKIAKATPGKASTTHPTKEMTT